MRRVGSNVCHSQEHLVMAVHDATSRRFGLNPGSTTPRY